MINWNGLIVLLALFYAVFLSRESWQAKKDRKKIKHIVHVNGTRGKSTVTRLIDAGLRAGGFQTVCKSTGTLPFLFHTDGTEEEIHRRGPANIREQLELLHLAAKEKADVLVIECMALDPELQWTCQHKMLKADIGVITNARIDHTDVMGNTREEILDCMMNMLPEDGSVFTAEKDLFSRIARKAEMIGSQAELALAEDVSDIGDSIDFPENVALALKICEHLGVERTKALNGMKKFVRDPYAMKIFHKGNFTFVNAMATNDVTSAKIVYKKSAEKYAGKLVILINNREDRPARALEMVRLCKELKPAEIVLLGDQQGALRGCCRRELSDVPVRNCKSAEEVPFQWEYPVLMLAVGNIKNEGIRLFDRAERELEGDI